MDPLLTLVTVILLTNTNGYHLSSQKLNWADASKYCINQCGSTLATINTRKANRLAQRLIVESNREKEGVWIGLLGDTWTDSTEYKYTRMITNTHVSDKCTVINPVDQYKWTNTECDKSYRFICNTCDGVLNEESESNQQWTVIQGNENALTIDSDNQIAFTINSKHDDTIAIINAKQWKQCAQYKPWIVEMKYDIISQEDKDYDIALVFYTSKTSERDHYFVGVKSTETDAITESESISTTTRTVEVSFGYMIDNTKQIIALEHILDMPWTDNMEETLRVEIEYGLRFKVSINNQLLIKTGFNVNPMHRSTNEAMSGYVGVQTSYADIKVRQFTVSGMPLYDQENDEEWMKTDCIFIYDEADDEADNDMIDIIDGGPMSDIVPDDENNDNQNETDENINNGGEMNMHPDSDIIPNEQVNGFPKQVLAYAAIIGIFCCMVCVGIYYLKLKRKRKRKLDKLFGRNDERNVSIDMATSTVNDNDIGADVILPAHGFGFNHSNEFANNNNNNNSNPLHADNSSNLNFDGPQPIGIDLEMGQPSLDQFQFSNVQIDSFAQYNNYNPYQPKTSFAANVAAWDIGAMEANCNNILKSQGRHSKHSRHASFS